MGLLLICDHASGIAAGLARVTRPLLRVQFTRACSQPVRVSLLLALFSFEIVEFGIEFGVELDIFGRAKPLANVARVGKRVVHVVDYALSIGSVGVELLQRRCASAQRVQRLCGVVRCVNALDDRLNLQQSGSSLLAGLLEPCAPL